MSDQCQKQGLGIELLRRVVQIARDERLGRVSAEMLGDNLTVQSIFKKAGFRLRLLADPPPYRRCLTSDFCDASHNPLELRS